MKKYLYTLLFIFTASISLAGNPELTSKTNGNRSQGSMTIDAGDSVVFDMSQSVINGNTAEFPVYILSDDIINALDFSFKYNQAEFIYDTIINLTTYISPLAFYNATDSTVRFTSSSLQTYDNGLPLVSVRFTMLAGPICTSDLNSITVYLNGDPCSFRVVECLTDGLQESVNNASIKTYPNPANEILFVEAPEEATIEMFDMNGRQMVIQSKAISKGRKEINTQNIAAGIYALKIYQNNFLSMKKVVIQK